MFSNHLSDSHFLKACLAAMLAIGLMACSSSSDNGTPPPTDTMEMVPTAYETAKAAIAAAETAEAAQKVVDDLDADAVTGTELESLKMAVAQKTMELEAAAAKERRDMLIAAAACEAATAECVAAHDALIAALQADVNRLADDDDATNAQQAAAQDALEEAQAARNLVQMDLDELDRTTTAGREVGEAIDAANGLATDRGADAIAAAKIAIEEAEMAVGDSDAYDERIAMAKTAVARAEELNAIDMALMEADEAADGLVEDSDADAVSAAQALIDAAQKLIDENEHLTEAEETSYTEDIADLQRPVTLAKNRNDAATKEEADRMAAEETEEQRKANEAMAATAAKLYAGIYAPAANATGTEVSDVHAAYNTAGTAIAVTIGTGDAAGTAVTLSEDKKTPIADLRSWAGKRYADPAGGDEYEAVVYSNVEAAEQGKKFSAQYPDTETFVTAGVVDVDTSGSDTPESRVGGSNLDIAAGVKRFPLPDPNPNSHTVVTVSGTFHGVAGTYSCTPGSAVCAARKAADGIELGTVPSATVATFTDGGGDWKFTPANSASRVSEVRDTHYASYGWWIKRAANNGAFTASAFVDEKGTVEDASGVDDLEGTATYQGGAAGKYALASSTGGTNDAGHFTARATLEADFSNNDEDTAITGTLDMFIGEDGESRDWSVKLGASQIGDDGKIGVASDTADATVTTIWTIGETAAAKSGEWTGNLRNNGDDGVPLVATGTFYTEYGTAGKMVGAFGANKQ